MSNIICATTDNHCCFSGSIISTVECSKKPNYTSSKPIAWQTIQKQASKFEKQAKNEVWQKLKKRYKTYEPQRNV